MGHLYLEIVFKCDATLADFAVFGKIVEVASPRQTYSELVVVLQFCTELPSPLEPVPSLMMVFRNHSFRLRVIYHIVRIFVQVIGFLVEVLNCSILDSCRFTSVTSYDVESEVQSHKWHQCQL